MPPRIRKLIGTAALPGNADLHDRMRATRTNDTVIASIGDPEKGFAAAPLVVDSFRAEAGGCCRRRDRSALRSIDGLGPIGAIPPNHRGAVRFCVRLPNLASRAIVAGAHWRGETT